jgi:hypothetical protein
MMKRLISLMSLLAIVATVNVSCSKDDDPAQPAGKTKTELITKASWKFEKAVAGGSDISLAIKSCLKDNTVTFAVNKTGSISEEADICSPSSAGNFTWEFQTNETILHSSQPVFPGGSNDFKIVSLTETNLVVSQMMTVSPYPPTTVEVTFKH